MLTQDPIGLAGGVNLYAYAGSNPVAWSDPYGLDCKPNDALCYIARLGYQVLGVITGGSFGAGAGGGAGLSCTVGAVVCSPVGAVVGGVAGGIAGGMAAGDYFDDNLSRYFDGGGDGVQQPPRDPAKGLKAQLERHQQKLADYIRNPDAHDNKGFLRNASPEIRQKVIDARVRQLQKQIRNFEEQIRQIQGAK